MEKQFILQYLAPDGSKNTHVFDSAEERAEFIKDEGLEGREDVRTKDTFN